MSAIEESGWQVGDDGVVVATLTDPLNKHAAIDPSTVTVAVTGTKGDGTTPFTLTVTNVANKYSAPIFFDVAGTWHGHITVTGARRRKIPFRVVVANA